MTDAATTPDLDQEIQDAADADARRYKLTHARLDPAHALAPGLFRSLRSGDRSDEAAQPLNLVYQYGKNCKLAFVGPKLLGADDLRVLQGLVALAAGGRELGPTSASAMALAIRQGLGISPDQKTLIAVGRFPSLAREIGYKNDGGGTVTRIRECVTRLGSVVIWETIGSRTRKFSILSSVEFDEQSGEFCIGINPRLAEAILGKRQTRVPMAEVRTLESDAARVIHQRICGFVNEGKGHKLSFKTLVGYAWPDECSEGTYRARKHTVRKALGEFKAMGWTVEEAEGDAVVVTRPPRSY